MDRLKVGDTVWYSGNGCGVVAATVSMLFGNRLVKVVRGPYTYTVHSRDVSTTEELITRLEQELSSNGKEEDTPR